MPRTSCEFLLCDPRLYAYASSAFPLCAFSSLPCIADDFSNCTIHFLTVHVARPLGEYAVVYVSRDPARASPVVVVEAESIQPG